MTRLRPKQQTLAPRGVTAPIDEFAALMSRSTDRIAGMMQDLIRAEFNRDRKAFSKARRQLYDSIAAAQAFADLLGRRRMLLEADAATARKPVGVEAAAEVTRLFSFSLGSERPPQVPNVPFDEAVRDLLEREPRLAGGWREVQKLYQRGPYFSVARAPDAAAVKKAQATIQRLIREGRTLDQASQLLQQTNDWSRAYADTVYRTNLSTAYTAGRFRQALDPDVADVIGALRFTATLDRDTRPNHKAAHGVIAAQNDRIWNFLAPPLGHQ